MIKQTLMVVATLALAGAHTARADEMADLAKLGKCNVLGAQKAALEAAAGRVWCPATHFSAGTAAPLPAGKVLIGLALSLRKGHDVGDALTNSVSVAALVIDADGKKVALTQFVGAYAADEQAEAEAKASLALVLKGKAPSAAIPAAFAVSARALSGVAPIAKTGGGWTWSEEGALELRLVDKTWVAIETTTAGIFVDVFVADWTSK